MILQALRASELVSFLANMHLPVVQVQPRVLDSKNPRELLQIHSFTHWLPYSLPHALNTKLPILQRQLVMSTRYAWSTCELSGGHFLAGWVTSYRKDRLTYIWHNLLPYIVIIRIGDLEKKNWLICSKRLSEIAFFIWLWFPSSLTCQQSVKRGSGCTPL